VKCFKDTSFYKKNIKSYKIILNFNLFLENDDGSRCLNSGSCLGFGHNNPKNHKSHKSIKNCPQEKYHADLRKNPSKWSNLILKNKLAALTAELGRIKNQNCDTCEPKDLK
jgi:hypothetical protein